MEKFNQRYLADRRVVNEVHECLRLFPKQLVDFKLASAIYWSQNNQDLIRIEAVKTYRFLLTVFIPVLMRKQRVN